jgi:2-succinyl-5-enolpyruvyl-6-hydroxy-3-cyclohexene-1-carboxylate synthase
MPTSKPYRQWLEAHPEVEQIVVDPHGWSDPTSMAFELIQSDPIRLAQSVADQLESRGPRPTTPYTSTWVEAGRRAREVIDAKLMGSELLSEPSVARLLADVLPDPATLFLANSMPVRDVDQAWPVGDRTLRVFGNRGVNGIDGTISSAFGTAAAGRWPLVVLTGDLALLHSWTGLLDVRGTPVDATVIVLDNGGGGIFHLLPGASNVEPALFERHFGTPHRVELLGAIRAFGFDAREAVTAKEFRAAVKESIKRPGVQFVVVRTDRAANEALHRELNESVAQVLQKGSSV